jgi:predicted type IV restriction endonuclease
MVATIAAEKLTLYDLEKSFNLTLCDRADFFPEWTIDNLPISKLISQKEKEQLDHIKTNYIHLSKRPMLEEMVKMVVLSPLLDMAGFYQPPFYSVAEKSVKVSVKDENLTIRGKIDVLVLQERFWILVIESKQVGVSLQKGIPQAIAYMLANPNRQKDVYGMVTNGSNFIFLKLSWRDKPIYGISDEYTLMRHENDLYAILQILKTIGKAII